MDPAGGEREEASRHWEEGKLEQEVNTELNLSMARPSLPDRKDKAAALAVSRSAETVPLSTDHKLKNQRHSRLQGRRTCGGRRGGAVAAGMSQPEQRAKSKAKVSKSCTKECEIVKPDFSTTYPPPGAAGYSSLYAEILSQSEFDLYPHPEETSDQESEELPPLTESTLLDSELSLTNQEVSEVSEASSALSLNAGHISAEADNAIEEQHLTRSRKSGAKQGLHDDNDARSGNDEQLLRSSGITCTLREIKDIKKSEATDMSTEVKDGHEQDGATRSQSLNSEVTSFVSGTPEPHYVKPRACLRARIPPGSNDKSSEHSGPQTLLEPAINPRPSELSARFDMDVTSGRQCHPHRPRSRPNSPGVCTSGHVSPPGAQWALNGVLRNVELLPTLIKPTICRLQALDTGQDQPDCNTSRSGQTGRGGSHSAALHRNLHQAVSSVQQGQQKDKSGVENSSASDLSQNQSEFMIAGRSEMSGLELSDRSASSMRERFLINKESSLDQGSQRLPRAISPAISILSLHSLTEVKCHYARRDHNDVIHGDLLVGSWTSDPGSAQYVKRANVQAADSVLKEKEQPEDSTSGTSGPPAGPGNISPYGQHTTACVSVTQSHEEPCPITEPEPPPDPIIRPDTEKMTSDVQSQPDTRQLCTPSAQPLLHKSAQTGQGAQASSAQADEAAHVTTAQAGQVSQVITGQRDQAIQATTAPIDQAMEVTTAQTDQAARVTTAQTDQPAQVTTAQTDQPARVTAAQSGSEKEIERADVNSQVVSCPPMPHVRSLSYLPAHSRNCKDTMGQTALPTQDYLPFLHTLRNRSLSRKFMPYQHAKPRKLDNIRRGPEDGAHSSTNSGDARAEDAASTSHAFPRGREIPPGWRPGLATSHPITIMSAAYSRPKRQPRKVRGRRQRRQSVPQSVPRQSVRQYHAWLKKTMADSRPDKRIGQSTQAKLSRSDSSVSPESSHQKLPVRTVCSSEDEDVQRGQGRSLSKENFDFKRKYYENLRRQQGRRQCLDGQSEAPPPQTKRITSQVTLLKTLDELYLSESPDEEWTESNIGDSVRVCSPNAELLQQQMFLLKYYNGRLHRQSDETIEFLANSQKTTKGIRIRRDTTSMVPSIISNERLKSLCATALPEHTPGMATTDRIKPGQPWEQQTQGSEQVKQQTPFLKSTCSVLTSNDMASLTSWKNEPTIEPMAAVVRKEAVRARMVKAKAASSPFVYMLSTESTATALAGSAESRYVGPSLPSSSTARPLLGLTSDPRLPRSASDNKYGALFANKSKSFDRDCPRQPATRLKITQTNDREADNSGRGKGRVRFADQPPPLSHLSQSWNRCEEDTWCDSINAMLLRANKVQEENDFMKKNKSSYPRPDSAKIVSPVVPKSATFLGQLLKQDHMDRQQARTTAAKVRGRMDENLARIILTRTQQHRITTLGANTSMDAVSGTYQRRPPPAAAASTSSPQTAVSSSSGNDGKSSMSTQATPLPTSRTDQRHGTSNGVKSAGVLHIQVQMSRRATERMWKTHEKLRKQKSGVGAGAAVTSFNKNARPKKLAPLRISKPMDFVNPDAKHLRRNPIREFKDASHTGQPRSSSDLFLPIPEPAAKAQESTETNYLLDRYSDTFRYYKNQPMGNHKPAIVQMFSDPFEKDCNNNARYHYSTHGSQETTPFAHSSDDNLQFSQPLRDPSADLCISDTYQYRIPGTGTQQRKAKIGSNFSSSNTAIPAAVNCTRFNSRMSLSENEEEVKGSHELAQTDDTLIDYVVSYNHYAGGRHDPHGLCTEVDSRTWGSECLELNQSQPSQVRLDHRYNTPGVTQLAPARGSEDRRSDRGLVSTLDHQLFVKAVLDYPAVQPRSPTTAKMCDNNELLQHYACQAYQAYRSSVLSNTDLSPDLGGCSHLWVPNNHQVRQVVEVGQPEMDIGHREGQDMNSSHEMTSEGSVPHQPTSRGPHSSQAKSESVTQMAQSDSALYNRDHSAAFDDHTRPLVGEDAQNPRTASEIPPQTVYPAQTPSWHLGDDGDLVSGTGLMSVTGQPVKLAVKTSTSQPGPSSSPSCSLGNSKLFSRRLQGVKMSQDRVQDHSRGAAYGLSRQKPPGPAKTLAERKPVDMHIKNMKMGRQRPVKTTSSNTKAEDKGTQQTARAKRNGPLHVTFEGPSPDQSGSNRGVVDIGGLGTGQSSWGTQILQHRPQNDVNFHWEEIKVPPPFKKNWDPLEDFSAEVQQHQQPQQQHQQQQQQEQQGQQQYDLYSVQQRRLLMAEPIIKDACPSQYSSSSTSLHMANASPVTDSVAECQGTHNSNTMEIREDLKADSSPRPVSQIDTAFRAEVNDQENTISEVSDEFEGEINPCKTPWNSLMIESSLATVGTPPHSILSPATFKMDSTMGVAPPPTARTEEMSSEHSTSSTTCTDSSGLSPLRPTIDRQFLKRLRGPDIIQVVGGNSNRLMEGLHAVTRYRCYIPVFQLRSLEPAEFSPLVLQVNHCASVYDNYQWSRKGAKFHSWIVFYTEDASSYIHSIHTVQWLPTGLFTLHPTQKTDSCEDPGFAQEVKAARLLHYSYEGSDLAFSSDQVYLFGREMQTRERALAVLVSLHDQLRNQPAAQYFAHLCGWIPPLLYSRTVCLPPIHQPRLKDTAEVRQTHWSRAGQGQSVGPSVVTELYLPEVKRREAASCQPDPAPDAVPRLPAIRCLPYQPGCERLPATFLCLRCGTFMAGQPELLTTPAQPGRPLSTVNLASLGPSDQPNVQLSRPHTATHSLPKVTTDSWEVTGKGFALQRQTHSVLGRPASPTEQIIHAAVTEYVEDAQAAAADRKSLSMTSVTDLEQLTEFSLPPHPTTSSLPHQRRKEWWEKNRHKLLRQPSQQHSQQRGQIAVTMTSQPQATSQSRTGPDRQSGDSALYTPQLSPKPPRSNMAGWNWTPPAEMEDEERSLLVIATWNAPIIPPPFSEGQARPPGHGQPIVARVKPMKNTHKTEYTRHRRTLSRISQSYKSPYWTKKEVKCKPSPVSDSSGERPSPSLSSSSSSSSETDSGSESASNDSVSGSGSSAAGWDFFTRYANKGGPTSIDDIIQRTLPRHHPRHSPHLLKKAKEREEAGQLGYPRDLETVSSGSELREATERSERSVTFALSEYDMCSDAEEVKELWKVCFPEISFWDRRRKKKPQKTKIWA